jgi:hypothetical protein
MGREQAGQGGILDAGKEDTSFVFRPRSNFQKKRFFLFFVGDLPFCLFFFWFLFSGCFVFGFRVAASPPRMQGVWVSGAEG